MPCGVFCTAVDAVEDSEVDSVEDSLVLFSDVLSSEVSDESESDMLFELLAGADGFLPAFTKAKTTAQIMKTAIMAMTIIIFLFGLVLFSSSEFSASTVCSASL